MYKAQHVRNQEANFDLLNTSLHFKKFTFVESSSIFKCHFCKTECKELWNLGIHSCGNRQKLRFTCDICAKRFETRRDLFGHYKMHKMDDLYECYFCSNKFTCSGLKLHVSSNTSRIYQCKVCHIEFKRKCVFDKHMVSHAINHSSHSKGMIICPVKYLRHTSEVSEELVTSNRQTYPRDVIFHSQVSGSVSKKKDIVISVYKNIIFQLEENVVTGVVPNLSADDFQTFTLNPLKIETSPEKCVPGNRYQTAFSSFQNIEVGNNLLAIKCPTEEINSRYHQIINAPNFGRHPSIIQITVNIPQLLVCQPEPRKNHEQTNLQAVSDPKTTNQKVDKIPAVLYHPHIGMYCPEITILQPQQTASSYIPVQLLHHVPYSSYSIASFENPSKQTSNIPATLVQSSGAYHAEHNVPNCTKVTFLPHSFQLTGNLPHQTTNIIPDLHLYPSTSMDYPPNVFSQPQYNSINTLIGSNYNQTITSHPHLERNIISDTQNHPSRDASSLGDIEYMLQQSALNNAEVKILSSDHQHNGNPTDQGTKVIPIEQHNPSVNVFHMQIPESHAEQNAHRIGYTCLSPHNFVVKQTNKKTKICSSQQHSSFVDLSPLQNDEYLPIHNVLNSIDAEFLSPKFQLENQTETDQESNNIPSGQVQVSSEDASFVTSLANL